MEPLMGMRVQTAGRPLQVAAVTVAVIALALVATMRPQQTQTWSTGIVSLSNPVLAGVVAQQPTARSGGDIPSSTHIERSAASRMQLSQRPTAAADHQTRVPVLGMVAMACVAVVGFILRESRRLPAKYMEVPLLAVSMGGFPEMQVPYYDDLGFQARTIAAFPDKAIATPDEARVLWAKDGYAILDVRSDYEREDRGPIRAEKGTVNIPLFFAKYVYDPTVGRKVVRQQVNPKWLDQVKAKFPKKDAKLVVMCSDGRLRSMQALELLDGEGYTHLVGMKGGYNTWDETFDRLLRRRDVGVATEVYNHVDSDGSPIAGCGIHASGAQFEMMDSVKFDKIPTKDPVPWGDWTEAVSKIAMFSVTGTPVAVLAPDAPAMPPVEDPPVPEALVAGELEVASDTPEAGDLIVNVTEEGTAVEEVPATVAWEPTPVVIPAAELRFDTEAFIAKVIEDFPDKTLANYEEARVLWSQGGYEIVDVRSEWEGEETGRITAEKGSLTLSLIHSQKVFDDALGQDVLVQEPNAQFVDDFVAMFPNVEEKVLLMDSDGCDRALQAMGLLHQRGYLNVCAMRGGFNTWNTAYMAGIQRRFPDIDDITEVERLAPTDPIAWLDWAVAMDPCPLTIKG